MGKTMRCFVGCIHGGACPTAATKWGRRILPHARPSSGVACGSYRRPGFKFASRIVVSASALAAPGSASSVAWRSQKFLLRGLLRCRL
jgi:hypothetical protein